MDGIPHISIDDQDLRDFEELTAQESHSIDGQIIKMGMVETMIRRRDHQTKREKSIEIRTTTGKTGSELAEELGKSIQNISISRMHLGDGRYNLIVEKGDDDPDNEDPSIYRVMFPAHVDTVKSGAPTQLLHEPRHPDRVRGLGVYDMAAGVLNNIALADSVRVPRGVKAYFVFTVDEEKNSVGARELIKQWDIWPLISAVASSEIGPVPPLPDDSPQMRLITARGGRVKFLGDITVDVRSQGHGAEAGLANASKAKRTLLNALDDRFYEGYTPPVPTEAFEPPQQRKHELFQPEMIEDGVDHSWLTREGYFPVDRAQFELAIRMVPPSTVQEYIANVQRWVRGISKGGEWKAYGINYTLNRNPNNASYSPYEMGKDHPIVRVASAVIHRITGMLPDIVGAPSVADECDYAEAGKPIITIPPNGDEAHHPDEWVSLSSTMRIREVMRALIEDEDGFRSLLAASAQIK